MENENMIEIEENMEQREKPSDKVKEKIHRTGEKLTETKERFTQTKERIVSNHKMQIFSKVLTVVVTIGIAALAVVGYRAGAFRSITSLQMWVADFGIVAPLIFIILQAAQVAIPIIPGGLTLLGGVAIFGSWNGFWYNYIGIVIGSILVFAISRVYGKPLMYKLFKAESIEKYEKWTDNHGVFTKLFAVAILLPGAPDGLICYLAGTTKMSWKTYMLIILLGKPLSIAMYSLGFFTMTKGISMVG